MRDNSFWAMCVTIVIAFIFGVCVGHKDGISSHAIITSYDTIRIVKYDTTKVIEPVYVSKTIIRYDTIWSNCVEVDNYSVYDTIPVVYVPIAQSYYSGDHYDAWVSGYNASLDSINVFHETIENTIYIEKKKRWGLGIQAGMTYDNKVHPYIGIGVSYNLFNW